MLRIQSVDPLADGLRYLSLLISFDPGPEGAEETSPAHVSVSGRPNRVGGEHHCVLPSPGLSSADSHLEFESLSDAKQQSTLFEEGNQMIYRRAVQMLLMGLLCLATAPAGVQEAKVNPLMTKDLIGLTGKEATMLTVEYAPGASSAKHRHNANTFVYVLEGSIVMQVEGGKAVTLGPGQTFYESPEDIHVVSKNASDTKPAKFLVFFVKDKGAASLVPVSQ